MELLFKYVINIFISYLKGCVQGYGNYEELTASSVDPKVGLVTIYISKLVWKSFLIPYAFRIKININFQV